ncbi:MAG: hypothetical protein DMF95_21385 [Acidobacteria bacterium]|nr:MAG: hypothetical protein DMF95_21385 [Acidobacteriota bacterium]
MSRPAVGSVLRFVLGSVVAVAIGGVARAQEPLPPAYLAVVEGTATLERDGEAQPAVVNMPFVPGDRLRTAAGRVEIDFPDGTTIEVAAYSEVEAVSPTRVRVVAGTIDHLQRSPAAAVETASAAYLPQDLRQYGSALDRNGSWQNTAPYGYVWYPTVAPDWRPYYYGSWAPVPPYGWTWIGVDTWSWPTHHYGRWGYGRNAWFWIPGRTWGSAWVSWASATDYVSWCPLGYDGRPVFGYSVFGSDSGARFRTGMDPAWRGWTVMSRGQFGARGAYAPRYEVDPRRIASNTPFIVQAHAPVALPHAGSGGTVTSPGRSAGLAVPRVGVREPVVPGRTRDPRSAPTATPTTTDDRRPGDYRRGGAVAMPRVETPRAEMRRAPEAPPASAPGPTLAGAQAAPVATPQPSTGYRPPPAASRPPAPDSRRDDGSRRAPSYGAPSRSAQPERAAPAERAAPPAERPAPTERSAPRSAAPPERAAPPPRSAPAGAPHEGNARERSGGGAAPAGARRPR